MRSFSKIAAYVILLTCQEPIQQHKIPPTARDPKHPLYSRGFCGLGQGGRRSLSIKPGLLEGKCNILLRHGHSSYCLKTMYNIKVGPWSEHTLCQLCQVPEWCRQGNILVIIAPYMQGANNAECLGFAFFYLYLYVSIRKIEAGWRMFWIRLLHPLKKQTIPTTTTGKISILKSYLVL